MPSCTRTTCSALLAMLAIALAALAGPLSTPATAGPSTGTVSGTIRNPVGVTLPAVTVSIGTTSTTTDLNGHYALTGVPFGSQSLTVYRTCFKKVTTPVVVDGAETKDVTIVQQRDPFGYVCGDYATIYTTTPDTVLSQAKGDDAIQAIDLPFPISFYGQTKTKAYVSTNGYVTFTPQTGSDATFSNRALLDPATPRDAIFAFWDDLVIDASAQIRISTTNMGPAGFRSFVIQWRNALIYGTNDRVTVDLSLEEEGWFGITWESGSGTDRSMGSSATIGFRNSTTGAGAQAFLRSLLAPDALPTHVTMFSTNDPPVADAGADRTVTSGAGFTLDGGNSSDPDTFSFDLGYRWKQIGGPATTLKTPGQTTTKVVGVSRPKTLTYQLTVTDPAGFTDTDTVVVKVKG